MSPAEAANLRNRVAQLEADCEYYKNQVDVLKRALFGKSSEKTKFIDPKSHQMVFPLFSDINDVEKDITDKKQDTPPDTITNPKTQTNKKRGRKRVNKNLETEEIILYASEEQKKDEHGQDLVLLGYEESEKTHYIPGKLKRQVIKREIWGHPKSREQVSIAEPLKSIIPKGKFSDSLIHHIVYEKYFVGTPLYRIARSLNDQGADLAKSTLSDAVAGFAKFYEPIYNSLHIELLKSKYIHADETRIRVQTEEKLSQFWLLRNEQHCFVHYGRTRASKEIDGLLLLRPKEKYGGHVMCDDYSGYNNLSRNGIILMACWAHIRRKFFELAPQNKIAQEAVDIINSLYRIERYAKESRLKNDWNDKIFHKKRFAIRKEKSALIYNNFKKFIETHHGQVAPASSLGIALSYAYKNLDSLKVFLSDGELPFDNNNAERSIRLLVIGRKNYLFVGSHDFGKWAAICYSIMESCRINHIDPRSYLEKVTPLMLQGDSADYTQITPFALRDKLKKMPVNF